MRFRTAIIWNAISQFGQSGIQFIATIILARLLTPDDFGIIGMVTIFISLSQMMVDSEMGGALLRKKEVTNTDYSTLFYYNLGVSLILYLILFFCASLIAEFYKRMELIDIIRIIGLTIIIHAFRVVQKIMIFRELQFKFMAIVNVISGTISLFVAIIMAKHGFAYWSLIAQQITLALSNVIIMSWHNRFIPALKFSTESFKYQFTFGISLLGSDTVKTIANNIATNIIAKISPLQFAGYFTQSSRITNFCQSTLGSIMDQSIFPMMAKVENIEVTTRKYTQIFNYSIFCLSFLTFFLIVASRPIILLLLGKNWISSVWMFEILSLMIVPVSIQLLIRNLFKVINKTRVVFYLEIFKSLIVITSLLVMSMVGLKYIIWSLFISQSFSTLFMICTLNKNLNLKYTKYTLIFSLCLLANLAIYFVKPLLF